MSKDRISQQRQKKAHRKSRLTSKKQVVQRFGASPFRQSVFLILWAVISLPMLLIGGMSGNGGLIFVGVMTSLIWAPLIIGVTFWMRLLINEVGIDARFLGHRLTTTWDNVIGFDQTKGKEGFVLRDPMGGAGAIAMSTLVRVQTPINSPAYFGGRPDLIKQRRFIPIEAFAYWLRRGSMARTIAAYRPDLIASK